MASMCKELGMRVVAEGIETEAERDELERSGCDLMQGFLFAEPGDAFPSRVSERARRPPATAGWPPERADAPVARSLLGFGAGTRRAVRPSGGSEDVAADRRQP